MRSAAALTILLLVTSTTPAQNQAWAHKVFLQADSHDFGTCPRGAKLKHRFRMKNIYAVPIEIGKIRSSCGCLTFEASKQKLNPREEGYLEITMDAARFSGPKSIMLYVPVEGGPQFSSTAAFRITANARADVVFNPGEVNFGIVQAGAAPTRLIEVEYAGKHDWHILEVVKNKSSPFTVVPREKYRQAPGLFRTGKVGYELLVSLKPDAKTGSFRRNLLLKTNDSASPVLTVLVEGIVQAPLSVQPEVVDLGSVKLGQTAMRRVIVRGNQPFRIVSVKGAGAGLRATHSTQASSLHILNITCTPTKSGAAERQLQIQTDLGGGAAVAVTVRANVAK